MEEKVLVIFDRFDAFGKCSKAYVATTKEKVSELIREYEQYSDIVGHHIEKLYIHS
jgi:hypothetical protein